MIWVKERIATILVVACAIQTTLLVIAGTAFYVLHSIQSAPSPPLIPGATREEQEGPDVKKGWALGRQYRFTLLGAHGDSWSGAASRFEGGKSWDEVKAEWSSEFRQVRDEPFNLVIQPEINMIMPDPDNATPKVRRRVVMFLRAFAVGLKERR